MISKGRRKMCTKPGLDDITWQSLSLLSEAALLGLCHLFEARLNADPTHDTPIQTWVKVLAVMIPKVLSPVSVADWRPISLTSVLQKLYVACVQKICEDGCSPICDRLYGFRAGCQTAEVSETVRLAMQKSVLYNERVGWPLLEGQVPSAHKVARCMGGDFLYLEWACGGYGRVLRLAWCQDRRRWKR